MSKIHATNNESSLPVRSVRKVLSLLFGATIATCSAQAAVLGDYSGRTVAEVYAYGNGDVLFKVMPVVVGCEGGFWFVPADLGFKANLAALLLSQQSKSGVRVWGTTINFGVVRQSPHVSFISLD